MDRAKTHGLERPFRPLDFAGRASRLEFGWNVSLWLLSTLIALLAAPVFFEDRFAALLVALLIGMGGACSAYVRRLHDRNMSAWWVLPFFVLPPLLVALPMIETTYILDWPNGAGMSPGDGTGFGTALATVYAAMALLPFMLIALIVFLALPSHPGANRYGPEPGAVAA
ncbi:MAG: DUF805 domain-containing protein [Pseudomonadota bacterium]